MNKSFGHISPAGLIPAFVALASAFSAAASDPDMFIYRNDGGFSAVKLTEGTAISLASGSDTPMLEVTAPDCPQALSVPLSAVDSCAIRSTYIPVLRISLTDYPDATQLWDKELYLDATLDIEGNGYCEDATGLQLSVKGRGNSTWSMPKKPFRFKFPKKTSICGFKKMKSYAVLANFIDNTLLKNTVSLWLARQLGMPYVNSTAPCDLYLNDTYQGSYLITQKIGINGGSVDIDEQTGILFELSTEFDEQYRFRSPIYELPVMVKDPDFADLYADNPEGMTPDERFSLWRDDFIAAERKVDALKGFEAFDMESFVNYFLLCNIAGNNEIGFPKSLYIFKEAPGEGSLYKFGPPWDFDVCYNFLKPDGNGGYIESKPDNELWVNALFDRLRYTPGFREAYAQRFATFERDIYPEMLKFLDSQAALIEPSAKLNGVLWNEEADMQNWGHYTPSYDAKKNVAALRQWIVKRVEFLKSQIEKGKF